MVTGVILFVIFAAASTRFPLELGALINSSNHSAATLAKSAGLLLILAVTRSLALAVGAYLFYLSAEIALAKMRTRAFRAYLLRREGLGETAGQGGGTSLLWNDASHVRNIAGEVLPVAISESLMLLSAMSAMLYLDWRLGIVVLAISPVGFFASRRLAAAISEASINYQFHITSHNNGTSEDLSRKSVIFQFGRVAFHTLRYRKSLGKTVRGYNKIISLERNYAALNSFLSVFIIIVVFVLGAAIIRSDVAAGHIIAFVFLAQAVIQSVSVLVGLNARLAKHLGAAERFLHLATSVSENSIRRPVVPDLHQHTLRVEGLSHSYQGASEPSLMPLSFEARVGEVTVICGDSGSGKTTLSRLLLGMLVPSNGVATIGEVDITTMKPAALAKLVSYVPQEPSLISGTIAQNICYGNPKSTYLDIVRVSQLVGIHLFIDSLPDKYETSISSEFPCLSGGQQQRLAIARAFLTGAKILVLDEPTSALDHRTAINIFKLLQLIAAKEGLAILHISHTPDAKKHADRVIEIKTPVRPAES